MTLTYQPRWRPALSSPRRPARQLGQVDPRQEGTKLFEDFYDEWARETERAKRAAVEQRFLTTLQAKTAEYEQALSTALAETPIQAAKLVDARDRAAWLGVNLDNIWVNAPVHIDERSPYSPTQGLAWVEPANAIRTRVYEVEQSADKELTRMAEEFANRPWTETPGGGIPQIPRPGEEELTAGESGRRPRFWWDDAGDLFKKYWWVIPAGIGGYLLVSYLLSQEEEKKRSPKPQTA